MKLDQLRFPTYTDSQRIAELEAMRTLLRYVTMIAIVACATLTDRHAVACAICFPVPEVTPTDRLIEAEAVVLARESANRPFAFRAIEVLKGDLTNPEIDYFISSLDRRRLAENPDRAVVLVRGITPNTAFVNQAGASRQTPKAVWSSLGFASQRFETLVRAILAEAPHWRGLGSADRRALFFMPYLDHPERDIRDLAFLEVGRGSYDLLYLADRFVSAERIRANLDDPKYLQWWPLSIQLLGIEANEQERARIRNEMASRTRFDQPLNLWAWSAALVEVDGVDGIGWLERAFLAHPERAQETISNILLALSLHGHRGPGVLRERIVMSYALAIENHPALAAAIARDLAAWKDWRLAAQMAKLRLDIATLDGPSAYAIDAYIGAALADGSSGTRWTGGQGGQ